MNDVREFRGAHAGADVWVLAAGHSLDYLDVDFFKGRITVGVNEVGPRWGIRPTYTVVKERASAEIALAEQPGVPVIESEYDCGNYGMTKAEPRAGAYPFRHLPNQGEWFDAARDWPTDPDWLVVSWSTITSAMHFAAYTGAANVILVAHDCGQLGDQAYVSNYAPAPLEWLLAIEGQSRAVKAELVRRYGCRVYGLSPFITPDLEGVSFIGRNRLNAVAA